MRLSKKNHLLQLIPIAGILIYLGLYIYAVTVYPGGSQFDKYAAGYNWRHNYWCNLLASTAINGQINPARPVALTAMAILCLSISFFWWLFFGRSNFALPAKALFRVCGI